MPLRRSAVIVFVAALIGTGITARLGVWQLDRAAQKTALQTALDERRALPPLPPGELARQDAAAALQHHRRIQIEGRWLADHTIYLENRQMNGRPGFFVVTPLQLADGSAVLVQRGWLPRDMAERTRIAAVPTPAGNVGVAGRIAPPPGRLYEFAGAASGPIRQNIDVQAFSQEMRLPLRPLSIVQEDGAITSDPPGDGLLRQWPRPDAGVHKHYGYAFQWFALATLILGLYAWFQLIRPRRRR